MALSEKAIRLIIKQSRDASGEHFAAIRRELDPKSREIGYYHYSHNGGISRRRDAGLVATAIRELAVRLGAEFERFPAASWCGTWGRSLQSERAEREGDAIVAKYLEYIRNICKEM